MLVSIITLTYNSVDTIEKTLRSIQNQSYKNIEMIFVDNCSTDGTLDILKKYSNDKTILVSEKDKGIANAFNKGLKLSTGEIVGFLHSDDTLDEKDCIEQMVNCFQNNPINFFYANLNYTSKNNKIIRLWKADEKQGCIDNNLLKKKINVGWMPPHPTVYLRRNFLERIGEYDEKYKISFDYDYLLRSINNNLIKPYYLNKNFINMTIGGNSNKSIKNILKKMIEDYKIIKRNLNKGIVVLLLKNITKFPQFFIFFKKNQ